MPRRARPRLGALLLLAALAPRPAAARLPSDAAEQPPRLRICCALGYDLGLRFGARKAPVGVHNLVQADRLGHHRYRARSVFDEKNGLLYTCRAGFVDLGHLRSAADLYAHVFARLSADPTARRIELDIEDGGASVALHAPLDDATRRQVALRTAYDLTVWHEIVTGVGGRTVPVFSEVFSALSPEDLYSDLVGAHLGAAAVDSPLPYDEAMQRLVQAFLREAGARDIRNTRAALGQVEGRWWRQDVPVPERALLAVRNRAFGPELVPWQVPEPERLGCAAPRPLVARRPDPPGLEAMYTLELVPPLNSELGPGPYRPRDFEALVARAARALAEPEAPTPAPPELAGIRVMAFRGFGGVARGADGARAAGGLEVVGARSEGIGGDLSVIRFTTAYDPGPRGLVAHFTGIQADHLFFCTERGGERVHPPIAAWFQTCEPRGFFGVGGTLAQFQHDGGTGRWAMRPVEAHVSFSLLDDAFDPAFERRHLILSTGLSVENATRPDLEPNFSVRANAQLRGLLESEDRLWQARLHLGFRQDVLDRADYASEAGLSLLRRFVLRDEAERPIWGVTTVGLELAATRWTQPEAALDDHLLPLTPTDRQDSLRGLLTVGFSFERWVF